MNSVKIYTDGSCLGNPGPGGFAVIWDMDDGTHQEFSSGAYYTTNNRMELLAVVTGLNALRGAPFTVDLYTDSQYIVNAVEKGWLDGWVKRGWKLSDGKPVKNIDMWTSILMLMKVHTIKFHWVKGHAGNANNERCDQMARAEADKYKQEIEDNNASALELKEIDADAIEVSAVEVEDGD